MKLLNFSLEKLELNIDNTDIDFSNDFLGIEIFEDIFQPFLSGNLYINDQSNILAKYPLTGTEKIYISIKLNSKIGQDKFELKNLSVIRATPVELNKFQIQQRVAYTIHWTEQEGLSAIDNFSKSYKDKSISDMVEDISKNMIGRQLTDIDKTKNKYDIAFPFMTPLNMIDFVTKKYAKTSIDKYGYVYYTDINQETHYKSIAKMLGGLTSDYKIYITNKTENANTNFVTQNAFTSGLDIDMLIKNGYFGSRDSYFDIETKEIVEQENTVSDFRSNNNFLGRKSFYHKDLKDYKINHIETDENILTQNLALFSSMNNYNMIFNQQGDWSKKVGVLVDVDINSHIIDKFEKYDEHFSGKWLCIKQTHTFNANGYDLFSTMVKNAFDRSELSTVDRV